MMLRAILSMAGAAALAVLSVADTRSALLRSERDVALPLPWLNQPRDAVSRNERLFSDPVQLAGQEALVRRADVAALARDPLDGPALRQFGIVAGLPDPARAELPLRLAEKVSRRDLLVQLALVEVEIARGDIPAALHHYDRAMTVHPEVAPALTPVLARAINEADVRAALARFANRPWFPGFFESSLAQGAQAGALMALLQETRPVLGGQVSDLLLTGLAGQLVTRGDYVDARSLIVGDRDMAGVVGELGFSAMATDPRFAPFSWRLASDTAVQAQLGEANAMEVEVAAERSGFIAERTTLLPPGPHRLTLQLEAPQGGPTAQLTWQVNCLGTAAGRQLLTISPTAGADHLAQDFAFIVPADCVAQQWRVLAAAEPSQVPSRIRVTRMVVR